MKALLPALFAVSALCTSGRLVAEPWSTQPLVGVVGQYASNAPLATGNAQPETNAALILNLPVSYDGDDIHFVATPNIRYGNASGYSSITSNYFRLDSTAQLVNELGSTSVTAAAYRDSSLFYAGELANGVGVRRDTSALGIDWQRDLTERFQLQLAANTSRTLYAHTNAGDTGQQTAQDEVFSTLVDYRYTTFSPAFALAATELDTIRIIGSLGRYEALDEVSDSNNANLQLGFDRLLTEIWTLKTTAGYSRAEDRYNFFFGPYLLERIDSSQTGTVYSASLVRQSDVLGLSFGASRALVPTGFAYLARQQSVNFAVNYSYSERWTYNATLSWQTNTYPRTDGGSVEQKYYYVGLSASWHATEQWVVTLQTTKLLQEYGTPAVTGASSGVSVQISRQFYRKDL